MAHLITLALVLFAGTCYASQRIVGGSASSIENHPSIVQVEFQGVGSGTWSQNCAGAILNNIFVLSSARCFDGVLYDPSLRRVRAGSATRNSGGVVVGVQEAFNHPDYGVAAALDSDITVVRLSGFLTFTSTISQGRIPSPDSVIGESLAVVLAGWGNTEFGGSPSSELLDALVFVTNHNTCVSTYANLPIPSTVTDNMFCAAAVGRDSCTGDAGGPVYIGDIIVGVISFGHNCGVSEFPGVSTNVAGFTNWILDVTINNV